MSHSHVESARRILAALGFPGAQVNDRSALVLLAILDMAPERRWSTATARLIGITPIMDWIARHYDKAYAPNTRETIRRQTMHQFVQAGLALYNPDQPDRAVNSPHAAYQVSPEALVLLQGFGSRHWPARLAAYQRRRMGLSQRYARDREQQKIPVEIAPNLTIRLSPGAHSLLIKAVIEEFAPRFVPGARLLYPGDTGSKLGYFDGDALARLGVRIDRHGKMPDAVFHHPERNWLILVEAATSHGPVDGKRHQELMALFAASTPGRVYVTAFPSRSVMARYVGKIAWETEVWLADAPSHLIHFNGDRFLGPYPAGP